MEYAIFLEKSGIMQKDYQEHAVKWCVQLEKHTNPLLPIHGGIVADEMGLGKTIMMISVFAVNFVPKTLIILPNILLEQWQQEIYKTTKHKALIYHGNNKKKITLKQLQSTETYPIVLTTYSALINSDSLLFGVKWNRIVFDEAHHLRNKNKRYDGALLLKRDITWLLTGTPVQNRKSDFYNLCSVLNLPSSYYKTKKGVTEIMTKFVMRRTKLQVGINIPVCTIKKRVVIWNNKAEKEMSENIHKAIKHSTNETRLSLYLQARQCCILPELVTNKVQKMADNNIIPYVDKSSFKYTSKMDAVVATIIERKENGCGKLVFCHFKKEIDFLFQTLKQHGIENILIFDGRINQNKRLHDIKCSYDVILLQIQTGCEGLNLQKYFSEIYFTSPNWNPFIEDQAIARCHRIGQNKEVNVFKFEMRDFVNHNSETHEKIKINTLDHYIRKMHVKKYNIISQLVEN